MVAAASRATKSSNSTSEMARTPNSTPDSAGKKAIATKKSHGNISNSHTNISKSSILHYVAPNSYISNSIQRSPQYPSSRKNISNQHPPVYIETALNSVISTLIITVSPEHSNNSIISMRAKRSRSEKEEVAEIYDPRREKGRDGEVGRG